MSNAHQGWYRGREAESGMGTANRLRLLPVLLLVMAAIVVTLPATAMAFTSGGINYQITGATTAQVGDGLTPAVAAGTSSATIPGSVLYDGVTYSVTAIGDYAFDNRTALNSVVIPNTVKSIGHYAFRSCNTLPTVVIPGSVESIGSYTFADCEALASVTLGNGIKSIGGFAFYYCTALTSVNVPGSVTSIGPSAFGNCLALTGVALPTSVTEIADGVFAGCDSLTSITIPSSVTSIGSAAFAYTKLTSIVVPNSVTLVGSSAFLDCWELKTAAVGSSVTTIGDGAFNRCVKLTSISLPSSVTSVGDQAFRDCESLTTAMIPSSVTAIGYSVFRNCDSLTSITIPNSITSIGNEAFYSCDKLASITIPGSVTSIRTKAFFNCSKLTSVTLQGSPSLDSQAFNTVLSSSLAGVGSSYPFTGDAIWPPVEPKTVMGPIPSGGYAATYQNNTAAGTATVTLSGQGMDYTGSVTKTFTITKAPLAGATVEPIPLNCAYTSAEVRPEVKVTLGGKVLATSEYSVTYSNNTGVGTATVTVVGRGNHTGSATASFEIAPASLAGATISGITTNYAYTGGAIRPLPQVLLAGRVLPSGDYTVSYANNTAVGVGTVTVTGRGNCTDSASKTFAIVSPATVVGKITAAYGGASISGATVALSGGAGSAITASNGTFSISKLVPGAYTAVVKKSGYLTRSVKVTVAAGGRVSANVALARDVKTASISRKPNVSKVSYKRKRGVAQFTLSATMKGWGGKALSKRTVYLQTSRDGKKWKSTYKLRTSSKGKASKLLRIKSKQVRYYRWYVPAKSQVNLKTYSAKTKVTVK